MQNKSSEQIPKRSVGLFPGLKPVPQAD